MGKKKRIVQDEIKQDSVLAKPMSQDEKELILKKKRSSVLKTLLTAIIIIVLAAGSTAAVVIFEPWQYLPNSPTIVVKKYISALNDRNYQEIVKCLSPKMREATEKNLQNLGSEEALFNAVFASELKAKFGDDVRFSVQNFVKEEQALEDGMYQGENIKELYGVTKLVILTCDIVTIGSLGTNATPTYINCVKIKGSWYIDNMTE